MSESQIFEWLASLAQNPTWVYSAIVLLLVASSFGLPFPEEATLIVAGLITYISMNPTPEMDPQMAGKLDPIRVAVVCFLAVFLSDALVFFLGKFFGPKLKTVALFRRFFESKSWEKVDQWAQRYGHWAAGIFRFTPGIRFPGHFWCGMVGIPFWKFTAIDGTAALLTVPTQVLFVSYYGGWVLEHFKVVKVVLFCAIGVFVLYHLIRWYRSRTSKALES